MNMPPSYMPDIVLNILQSSCCHFCFVFNTWLSGSNVIYYVDEFPKCMYYFFSVCIHAAQLKKQYRHK